jgi:acyl carrier protein
MQEIIQKLKELLITRLKLKLTTEQISEETQLFGPDGLGLDSIDVLELVIGIRKEFGVEIADRQTAEKIFITIGSIARFIEEKR